ncbi:1,4-dihydroxy-2-naphthoate octaprenyltransferase [Echinicola strongylocentroti]|uniref:1,4-dihydroxy-2-naphthoate octaprenyltransferase n=1 Tax=Echinicola strongylocentroti TaxID=1795355 RepID=A0A2Z4IM14_9BACT|nr:1,4-dihydroxy-2-naphthoate polyprenyltransferase [Echinicola strongylocentroti]AWW31934.1 1,4-dihydroxy-2-naphthoate octaprenyltransferase [Echinicola strongylocentroti]
MDITLTSKKQAWLHAIRLRTLPLALASILMASFIAWFHGTFRWEVTVLAALTTTLLQILSNLANDYGDSVHGADSDDREGPIRAVQSGVIQPTEMKNAMILLGVLSFLCGVVLLYVALESWVLFFTFIGIGLLSIFAAVNYTSGANPYGYMGLGDISVFLFFGLVGVLGTYFLHSLDFSSTLILPALSLGFFSTAVLNINNIRDIESDHKAGKKSIPVRIGRKAAVRYNWALIILGNVSLLAFSWLENAPGALAALLVLPLMVGIGKNVGQKTKSSELDPYLKKMAISTLLWVLAFGVGLVSFS